LADKQLQLGEDNAYLALQEAWQQVLEVLDKKVTKPSFESFIKTARPMPIDENLVKIYTSSRFAKHWLESKQVEMIHGGPAQEVDTWFDVRRHAKQRTARSRPPKQSKQRTAP